MKVTKYEHACLILEDEGKKLIIDPGSYTKSLPEKLDNVDGLVITHVHADHFDPVHIKQIAQQNPTLDIFCTEEVAKQLEFKNPKVVTGGSGGEAGPFKLAFFGGQHAFVHGSSPTTQNVAVMINDKLYYPGDSFTLPDIKVPVLAAPVGGPWLKVGEIMDFVNAIKPNRSFPTHNAPLSAIGESQVEGWLKGITNEFGGSFELLEVGQSIEV